MLAGPAQDNDLNAERLLGSTENPSAEEGNNGGEREEE